jgi:membrane fusion protein, multidrug efflux system
MIPYARSVVAVTMAGLLFSACSNSNKTEPAKAGAEAAVPAAGRPPVAVTVAAVETAPLVDAINVVGSLAPKFAADVKSEVSGTVVSVSVTEWVSVRKGQQLARLDTSEAVAGIDAMKAGVAQARVSETRAKREYERALQLKQFGLITPQALDDAKSAVEAAEAGVAAAQTQVVAAETRLKKSTIVAPMDGVVAYRGVSVGDRVENMGGNAAMFRIVDNRLLDLTVSVPSTRLADVKVGQVLEFTTDVLPGRTFTGKVMFINPSIDEGSRSAKVIAEVVNKDGALKGGSFVKGTITVAERTEVLQVPREAVLNWNVEQQTGEVLVVKGNKAETRPVKTGRTTGAAVEVVSGVQAGEQVIVRGAFAVRSGDTVAITKGQGA